MHRVIRDNDRAHIEGVRQVTWDTGEMCEFASCLVSALDTIGAPVDYHRVMGLSGAAFRLTLHPNPWEPGSYSIASIAPDAHEPIRRALRAVGRQATIRGVADEAGDRAAIVDSIGRGVPVPAFGVVGPSDVSLITGFDADGAVLLGWSTYQDIKDDHDVPPDVTGYFRKPAWHANTRGYILLGGQVPVPPGRETSIDSLRWAAEIVRREAVRDMPTGLAAYDAWARAMLDDARFPGRSPEALGGPYLGILCINMMLDDRRSAARYLRAIADAETDIAADLLSAAECYDRTCSLRDDLSALVPEDFSDAAILRLADPSVRREYARVIAAMRASDEEAVGHVEACLSRLP